MPDQLQTLLDGANLPNETKAQLWDHFQASKNEDDLRQRMDAIPQLDQGLKANLWDMKVARRATQPAPSINTGNMLGDSTKPAHIGAGPSSFQEMGQKAISTIADPHVLLPTLGAAAAAPFTGGMSIPAAAMTMGAGTATGEAIAQGVDASGAIPKPPSGWDILANFGSGAMQELGGRLIAGPHLFTKTPMGERVEQLYGDKAGLADVIDHPAADWMKNVATAGLGGSARMNTAKTAKSVEGLQSIVNASEDFAPSGGAKLLPDPAMQGSDIRSAIIDRKGQFNSQIVQPNYNRFTQNYGGMPVKDAQGNVVGTVKSYIEKRSRLGNDIANVSNDGNGRQIKRQMMQEHDNLTQMIEGALPPNGKRDWEFARGAHKYMANTFENDTVNQLLQSPTKDTDVLNMLYDPSKIRSSDETVYAGGRPTEVSRNNYQILNQAKKAMGPIEWQHTAVAAAQKLIAAATDEQGMLNGAKLRTMAEGMNPDSKDLLFGVGPKAAKFDDLINTIAYGDRPTKSSAGTLFINIRQGAAILGGISAAGTAAGEVLGNDKAKEAGYGGMLASGALLISPNILARILTSPTARDWLAKSANAATPQIKDRLVRAAIAAAGQGAMQTGMRLRAEDNTFKQANERNQMPAFGLTPPPATTP